MRLISCVAQADTGVSVSMCVTTKLTFPCIVTLFSNPYVRYEYSPAMEYNQCHAVSFQDGALGYRNRSTQYSFLVLASQQQESCPGVLHSQQLQGAITG